MKHDKNDLYCECSGCLDAAEPRDSMLDEYDEQELDQFEQEILEGGE